MCGPSTSSQRKRPPSGLWEVLRYYYKSRSNYTGMEGLRAS